MDAHIFHVNDEVEDVPAVLAFAETVPDVFANAHPELCRVAPFVDGARPVQTVGAALELVHETVVLKHPFHGDDRFDGLEVNER